ncbi:MAG: hypothetical protein JWP03_119 [Phycisphaerales bacterium]|jgi:endonuclease III|nr:hypothetical protein [Phycisphaerales bacterium]
MKNASKRADDLKALARRLVKDIKPEVPPVQDPLKALVRGAMSFDVPDSRADEAVRLLDREFVDLNELRVATDLEIQELLGQRYPAIERRVAMITQSLNRIFEKEHTLSLDRLKTLGKREARQFLRELPDIHPFVEGYVMLFAFEGHAFPMDAETVAFFHGHGIIDEGSPLDEAQKFIEHHIKVEECADFFVALRRHMSDEAKAKRKK